MIVNPWALWTQVLVSALLRDVQDCEGNTFVERETTHCLRYNIFCCFRYGSGW